MTAPVDLRSDTVTRPSPAMRKAMAEAEVGDDVFGDDPTVKRLEAYAAELLGLEAAVFVPSGTMANQIALLTHCRPGDEVLVGEDAHCYRFESGGGGALAGVQFSVVGKGGHFSAEQAAAAVNVMDPGGHVPDTKLICVENTHNAGGGLVMDPADFAAISDVARGAGIALHLDGARLFNAVVALGVEAADFGRHADTVSFCLSKGLGAPVGSLLCGATATIRRARRYRKMLGGALRQVGVLAAAGLFALENHIPHLAVDHARARRIADALSMMRRVWLDPETVRTNIVIFRVEGLTPEAVCEAVRHDVWALPFGPDTLRVVLHRDVAEADVDRAIGAFRKILG